MELGMKSFMHNVRTGVAAAGMGAATMLGGCDGAKSSAPMYGEELKDVVEFYSGMGKKEKAIADSVATDYTMQKIISETKEITASANKNNAIADSVFFADSVKAKTPFQLQKVKQQRALNKELNELLLNLKKSVKPVMTGKDVQKVDSIINSVIGTHKTEQLIDLLKKSVKPVMTGKDVQKLDSIINSVISTSKTEQLIDSLMKAVKKVK